MIDKFLAFVKRDFFQEVSYRFAFVFQIWGIFFSIVMFYFLSKLVAADKFLGYAGGYFAFVLVGIAFLGFMTSGMTSYAASIRHGQMMGTLEAMLVTPTSLGVIVMASALWTYLRSSLNLAIYLFIGVLMGVSFAGAHWFAALLVLGLAVLAFAALGVLSAAFTLAFKRGNPITAVFGGLSALLGGAFFPVDQLPAWLQRVSEFIPLRHALDGMRGALLEGKGVVDLGRPLLILAVFAALLLPCALLAFKSAVRIAKRDGSLAQY